MTATKIKLTSICLYMRKLNFLETDLDFDIKACGYSQLNKYMKLSEYQRSKLFLLLMDVSSFKYTVELQ